MKKLGVCGHFGNGKQLLNGQTVKTKIITSELIKQYGENQVGIVDTYGGAKRTISHLTGLWKLTAECENVIILPAHNGLRIIAPFLTFINKKFRRCLHYVVIGGWLPELISNKSHLTKCLKKFDYIYVETQTMKDALEKQGFSNIVIMPNCKSLQTLSEDELVYSKTELFKLCTFSRVTEKKGIKEAVDAVKKANEILGRVAYTLDIYGQIEAEYADEFSTLEVSFPEYVKYMGSVDFDKSVEILSNYYALLFPTKYYTEGIPGTIIDAYAAGVPVISSRWESYADIIDDNVVGKGYDFSDNESLVTLLLNAAQHPEELNNMKKSCLKKAQDYEASKVVKTILSERLK